MEFFRRPLVLSSPPFLRKTFRRFLFSLKESTGRSLQGRVPLFVPTTPLWKSTPLLSNTVFASDYGLCLAPSRSLLSEPFPFSPRSSESFQAGLHNPSCRCLEFFCSFSPPQEARTISSTLLTQMILSASVLPPSFSPPERNGSVLPSGHVAFPCSENI